MAGIYLTLQEISKLFFKSDHTVLYFLQQSMDIPTAPYPQQHLLLSVSLSPSSACTVASQCDFNLQFPND